MKILDKITILVFLLSSLTLTWWGAHYYPFETGILVLVFTFVYYRVLYRNDGEPLKTIMGKVEETIRPLDYHSRILPALIYASIGVGLVYTSLLVSLLLIL